MAALEEAGRKTVADLNQDVHSWLQDLSDRIETLLHTHRVKITIEVEPKEQINGQLST